MARGRRYRRFRSEFARRAKDAVLLGESWEREVTTRMSRELRSTALAAAVLALGIGPARAWEGRTPHVAITPTVLPARILLDDAEDATPPQEAPQGSRMRRAATAPRDQADRMCLVLQTTVVIDGARQKAYALLCAGRDGIWRLTPDAPSG